MIRSNVKIQRVAARFLVALLFSTLVMPLTQAQNTGNTSTGNVFIPGGNLTPAGNASQASNNAAYNGFNPVTGTWSNSGSNTQPMNPTNGFNPQTGTWAGSTSTATGGTWSTGTGANGSSANIFTPSQAVSGATASSFSGASGNRLSSGPKVIPHVSVRPRLPIFNSVPIRNRF